MGMTLLVYIFRFRIPLWKVLQGSYGHEKPGKVMEF